MTALIALRRKYQWPVYVMNEVEMKWIAVAQHYALTSLR